MIFIDVASTAHFFRADDETLAPESGVLTSALHLARELGFDAKAAIADTAASAQAFAHASSPAKPHFISNPGEERENLATLALPLLLHLEGVTPWQSPRAIEQIVTFFYMLGFDKIQDLERFSLTSMQERWGEVGAQLWKRIHGLERHVISPLLSTEPLRDYLYLDFPLSLTSLLLHQVRHSLTYLFARLQGRCLFAQKLQLHLYCEYSETGYTIEVEPNNPSRDLELYLTLLENKLAAIDLDNPIREFDIEIVPVPERVQQFDFFEPRTSEKDKMDSLMSLFTQASIRVGRYQVRDAIMPEKTWQTFNDDKHDCLAFDEKPETTEEGAYQLLPAYGLSVRGAPRPSRLLREPKRLSIYELQRLKLLTGHPIERLEDAWWDGGEKRDYYFAVSSSGQCLWVYQNPTSQEYYLHGYFD